MDLIHIEQIQDRIYFIRGCKVMLDYDLAKIYGVTTSNLNLAVRRNWKRFPEDFMFQLSSDEHRALLLQFAISKGRGGRQIPPHAFTEHGVSMVRHVMDQEIVGKTDWSSRKLLQGDPIHQRSKDQRDNSLSGKHETVEDVCTVVLQPLSDRTKAKRPEPEYPVVKAPTHWHHV